MTVFEMERIMSSASDMDDLPLEAEGGIDDAEYARVMRRITIGDNGTDTEVSAFNSSI
jgi:FXSXX-COOH protein